VADDPSIVTAGIDITTEPGPFNTSGTWGSQIEVHGSSHAGAEALRDFVLAAIYEKIDRLTMEQWKELGK
jgi:hypothetical protein